MVQLAYATARSSLSDAEPRFVMPARGRAPRRSQPTAATGFSLARRVMVALAMLLLLATAGWGAARLMDSTLLGFVFADLLFLVGVALRGAVAPRSRAY